MKPAGTTSSWRGIDLAWVYSELLASVSRKTRCIHRAQDVVHDSLLRFVLSGKREDILQPHAYLRAVAGNVLSDHRTDAARFLSLDDELGTARGLLPRESSPSAERLADLQQRLESVQRILDCLPPKCREVFWLCRVEGRSQPEIAACLGISLNMVERHVMRALVDLRTARELLFP
jgi:RNA polymerase sigma factor (sigma-70 family)